MKLRQIIVGMALLGASLGVFQNCSEVQYSSLTSESDVSKLTDSSSDDDPNFIVDSPAETPTAPNMPSSDVDPVTFHCHINNLQDIQVNIKQVTLGLVPAKSVSGAQSLLELSQGLKIQVDQDQKASFIRLVLAEEGNVLVASDEQTHDLKTPSAQNSGLKIPLRGQNSFKAGVSYLVQFELDPSTQLVAAGSKCILKPVLKIIHVEPAQSNDDL